MLDRYCRRPFALLWSESRRFELFRDIEVLVAEAQEKAGTIAGGVARALAAQKLPDPARLAALEKELHHETLAFLTALGEGMGPLARYLHFGLTSSDVLDTVFCLQLREAAAYLIKDVEDLLEALKSRAFAYRYTPVMGRSHGMAAEPVTFGIRLAGFYSEWRRNLARLRQAQAEVSVCAISGAMGHFATVPPEVEAYVAEKLGLRPEPLSTQVIPRDRFAFFFSVLAVVASSVERMAVNFRLMQITEISETQEFFGPLQKGSSAMPHKRNPILSENLTGLARLVRGYAASACENVALWFERDMSHSSVERIGAPDATSILDFALHRLAGLVETLTVFPEHMAQNITRSLGIYASQKVLLHLVEKGLSREAAYRLVQAAACRAWQENRPFGDVVAGAEDLRAHLDAEEIGALLSFEADEQMVDSLFKRVFGAAVPSP